MNVLSFVNPGEIDPQAFTKIAVNAKPNSANPIGFFGTGLKYAIAIVLRLGGQIVIWSGQTRYTFGTTPGKFRDKELTNIWFREGRKKPVELAYTTDFGKKWEPWMAFRELYCNAKDEGGDCYAKIVAPEPEKTVIEVRCPELMEAFEKRTAFMLDPNQKPLFVTQGMEVYPGRSNGIYYRGVLIGQTDLDHDLTYNLTSYVELTEDRTMKHQYIFDYAVAGAWLRAGEQQKHLLRTVITSERDSFEGKLPWGSCPSEPSESFLDTVGELRREGAVVLDRVRDLFDKYKPQSGDPEEAELTPQERRMLDRAVHTIRKSLGYDVARYKIIPCRSLGSGTFGLAHRGRIFISKRAFEAGQVWVTGTLLEEFGHLALSWRDESRDMQNSLLNLLARTLDRLAELETDHMDIYQAQPPEAA